jgi:hypothetical protein
VAFESRCANDRSKTEGCINLQPCTSYEGRKSEVPTGGPEVVVFTCPPGEYSVRYLVRRKLVLRLFINSGEIAISAHQQAIYPIGAKPCRVMSRECIQFNIGICSYEYSVRKYWFPNLPILHLVPRFQLQPMFSILAMPGRLGCSETSFLSPQTNASASKKKQL